MKKIFGVSVGLLMMLTFGNAVYAAEKEVISDPEQYASRYFADFEERSCHSLENTSVAFTTCSSNW